MDFEILGRIEHVERIASGRSLRARERLNRTYGRGNWRKLKGVAWIRYVNGFVCRAELHWCEAHGIGRVEMRPKRQR